MHTTAEEKAGVLLTDQWNEMWSVVGTSCHQFAHSTYCKSTGILFEFWVKNDEPFSAFSKANIVATIV
jgi:hypothetical protein